MLPLWPGRIKAATVQRLALARQAPQTESGITNGYRERFLTQVGRVVVVGAGQAGGEAVQRLRAGSPDLDITMIGEEPLAPYQRPPLSKKYLSGELDAARILLRPAEVSNMSGLHFYPIAEWSGSIAPANGCASMAARSWAMTR